MVSKEPNLLLTGQTNGKSALADKLPGTMTVRSVLLNRDSPDIESRLKRRRNRTHQVRFKDLEDGSSSSGNSGTGENNSHQKAATDCDSPHPLRKHGSSRSPKPWTSRDGPVADGLPGQTSVVGAVRGDMASTIEVVAAFLARAPPHPLTPGPTRRCWAPPQANSLTLPMTRKPGTSTSTAIQTSPCLKKPQSLSSAHTRSHSLGDSVGIDGDDEHDSQDEYLTQKHPGSLGSKDQNGPQGSGDRTAVERRSKTSRTELKSSVAVVKTARHSCPPLVLHNSEPCHCSAVSYRDGPKRQGSITPSAVRRRKRLNRTTSDPGKEVHYCTTPTQTENPGAPAPPSNAKLCTTQVQTECTTPSPNFKYCTTQSQTESQDLSPPSSEIPSLTQNQSSQSYPSVGSNAEQDKTRVQTDSPGHSPNQQSCNTQTQTCSSCASPPLTVSANSVPTQPESPVTPTVTQDPPTAQTSTVPYCTPSPPLSAPTQTPEHCAKQTCSLPCKPACSSTGKPVCSSPSEPPSSPPNKPACSTPNKPPSSPPSKPASSTPSKPACSTPSKPACSTPSKPACSTPSKPACPSPAVPACPTPAVPACSSPAVPACPSPAVPACPSPAVPACSSPAVPACPSPAVPACSSPAVPACSSPAVPACSSPAVPACSSPTKPACISPLPAEALPSPCSTYAPNIVRQSVPYYTVVSPPVVTSTAVCSSPPSAALPCPIQNYNPPILNVSPTPLSYRSPTPNNTTANIVPSETNTDPPTVPNIENQPNRGAYNSTSAVNPNATQCTFVTQTALSCTSISYYTTTHPAGPAHQNSASPSYATLIQTVSHCNIPCQALQNTSSASIGITPYSSPVPKLKSCTSPPPLVKMYLSALPNAQTCATPTKAVPLYSSKFRAAPPYTPPSQAPNSTQDKRGIRLPPPPPPPPPPYTPRKQGSDPQTSATRIPALRADSKAAEKEKDKETEKKEDKKCMDSPKHCQRASSLKHRAQTPPAPAMKGGKDSSSSSPAKACFKPSCLSSAQAQLGALHKMLCSGANAPKSQHPLSPNQQGCSGARGSAGSEEAPPAGPLTASQADTLRQVQEILGGLVAGARCKLDPARVTEKLLSPNGPLHDIRSLQNQLHSLEGVLETSQNTIKVLLDVIQDLEKKEAERDGRHSYRTGQDIENCGTCRDCACIIYSVEHDFRLQEGQVVRTWKVGDPPEGSPQSATPQPSTPHQQDSPQAVRPSAATKKNRKKCFWFL